jgi:DNA-binding PadR family transcriptional regulator
MNRLDKEIMTVLLTSQQSMYGLEQTLKEKMKKSNYATVYRHIKKMQNDGLLKTVKTSRKNGKLDKRGTEKPELTNKGLATLLIEGDLQKEELMLAARKTLQKDFGDLSTLFLHEINMEEVFANTFLKMKSKINLKFFDETYFDETLTVSFVESVLESLKKTDLKKNTGNRAKARKFGRKYVEPRYVDNLRNIQKLLEHERNKFDHYAKIIGEFLKVLGDLKE